MLDTEWLDWLHDHGAYEAGGDQYSKTLYLLADSIDAETVLEIGAGWGHSAAAFAASMSKRKDCKIISVDLQPDRLISACREFVATSGVYWSIIAEDSAKVHIEDDIDLLYIDGDPFESRSDFDRFYPRVIPGGMVILDGYYVQGGPTETVNDLQATHPFGIIPYSEDGIYCMAVHRKPVVDDEKHTIRCRNCTMTSLHFSYASARDAAEEHIREEKHLVNVY